MRLDPLTKFCIFDTNDRGLTHGRMLQQSAFDLFRVDFDTAGVYPVVFPSPDGQLPLPVDDAQIARSPPTLPECLAGEFLISQIAFCKGTAGNRYFAGLPGVDDIFETAAGFNDLQAGARYRLANDRRCVRPDQHVVRSDDGGGTAPFRCQVCGADFRRECGEIPDKFLRSLFARIKRHAEVR